MELHLTDIRSIRSVADATDLLRRLGYTQSPRQINTNDLGLGEFSDHAVIKLGTRLRDGYGVFVGEVDRLPSSLAPFGRKLLQFNDHPLGLLGVKGDDGAWTSFAVIRPRVIKSDTGAQYRIAKMQIDVASPTRHDAEVLERLAWKPGDQSPQLEVDEAFDVEAVARAFFNGLRTHFEAIESAIKDRVDADVAVQIGVEQAGGIRRVAIRLVCQILFISFLQKKGLLANDRSYLYSLWKASRGVRRFSDLLESLFYETLSIPEDRRDPERSLPGVPFLNGGLFERSYGNIALRLPDTLFDDNTGLLGFLSRWTFTIHEEAPDEVDVAIDPELLGRVFENLISDEEQQAHGVVYTPRPIVQFMCRESLIQWLIKTAEIDEALARTIVTDDEAFHLVREAMGTEPVAKLLSKIEVGLDEIRILDPAVGSGAFLLGMLGELVRIRQLVNRQKFQRDADDALIHQWKLHFIEQTLFGVDLEPLAIELCRLRFWLSLIVDLDAKSKVPPLPNLDFRMVAGNSLTDFVAGVEIQSTRRSSASSVALALTSNEELTRLRQRYFYESDPTAKQALLVRIRELENEFVGRILATSPGDSKARRQFIEEAVRRFRSRDRVFPVFVPALHFPETYASGGWDVVILNPPYLSKKEVARRLSDGVRRDYELHYGSTNDLMLLFAERIGDFVKPSGTCAIIAQDSILSTIDATSVRAHITKCALKTVARTKCFEGQAVNGAILIWDNHKGSSPQEYRWIENYKKNPRDFAAASILSAANVVNGKSKAGDSDILVGTLADLRVLPNRVIWRPSDTARRLISIFSQLEPPLFRDLDGWEQLSQTAALKRTVDKLRQLKFFETTDPGTMVPLGCCIDGGQGLATADDKRFLAVLDDTAEGERVREQREKLLGQIKGSSLSAKFASMVAREGGIEPALIAAADEKEFEAFAFPRYIRIISAHHVYEGELNSNLKRSGVSGEVHFVPFEKGDRSEGSGIDAAGAKWYRVNPIVIDWSIEAVALLRERARSPGTKRPYFRNEALWGEAGVAWNTIARYLRVRLIPSGSIFGHKAPVIMPCVQWLDVYALMALLNSEIIEFIVKTFLGSLMMIEVGHVRRIPVPVLHTDQAEVLSTLGRSAVQRTQCGDASGLATVEAEINRITRKLYGVSEDEDLWVTR